MATDPSHPKVDAADPAWREIDDLLEELTGLAKSDFSAARFHGELLDRVVSALAASGGAIWSRAAEGNLHCEYQINLANMRITDEPDGQERHRRVIESVLRSGEQRLVPPRADAAGDDRAANPTDFLLVLCPWKLDDDSAGVIEVFQRPGASPKAQQGQLRFLSVVAELVADFHRNRRLREFRGRVAQWKRFEEFTERVHDGLDLRTVAYQVANEGRRMIGCDRVSLAIRRGSKYRIAAISGVDTFDRRANSVRQLERLAKVVAVTGEPLWHTGDPSDRPPEIEEPLNTYLDESHVRLLAVVPLKAPEKEKPSRRPKPLGVLIVERFEAVADEDLRRNVAAVQTHGELAVGNALELKSVPAAGLLRMLGKAGWFVRLRQLPFTVFVLAAIAAAAVALATVPADFKVDARGQLQPLVRCDIFAPSDGVVSELKTEHGKDVSARDVLAVLREPQLAQEFRRVWGELQTARKRLATVEAERLQNQRESQADRRRYGQLTAKREELKELIESLKRQYEIVQARQAELSVRSPIDGQVLTWNLTEDLQARPVMRGQLLMTVADVSGPWVLELRVPDDRIAYVLDAQRELGRKLDVSFILATDPGVTYEGRIDEVAVRTEVTEADDSVVPVTVSVDRDKIPELMPGASVAAKIDCGRRSVGYVWFHDLIEAARCWWVY